MRVNYLMVKKLDNLVENSHFEILYTGHVFLHDVVENS
jgi:hypothetical protein